MTRVPWSGVVQLERTKGLEDQSDLSSGAVQNIQSNHLFFDIAHSLVGRWAAPKTKVLWGVYENCLTSGRAKANVS